MQPQSVMPWSVRCVVFDLDGLMIDSEPLFEESARRLLARRGVALQRTVLCAMMGTPARQALQVFRDGHGLTETVEELRIESSQLFHEILGEERVKLLPGVVELLERLEKKGIPRAIATSSSRRSRSP